MKRILAIILMILVCASLLAACGGSDSADTAATALTAASAAPVAEITLDEFLSSDEGVSAVQDIVSSIESSAGGYGTARCYSEGQCLVVDCSFTLELDDESMTSVQKKLQEVFDDADTANGMLDIIDYLAAKGVSGARIKVRYLTMDGSVIAEYTY